MSPTPTEWMAIAATIGTACGGAITVAAKLVLTAAREMVAGQKEQTTAMVAGHEKMAAALADLKSEVVSLRTYVDVLAGVTERENSAPPPVPTRLNAVRKDRS